MCCAVHFQQNFKNWTSGNNDIDKFIQDTQLSVHKNFEIYKVLEWILYNRFYDIKYIAKGELYRAGWIDGNIVEWDDKNQNWKRKDQNMFVILKGLNNPTNVTFEFMNEVQYNNYYFMKVLKILIFY